MLRIEQDYQGKSLAAYDQYVQRKREADADWTTGASRAWANYVEQSQSAAATAEGAMQSWLSSTEDALTQFVQTGKLSFSDLANSIIADLARDCGPPGGDGGRRLHDEWMAWHCDSQ